jgi:hypothetical protein
MPLIPKALLALAVAIGAAVVVAVLHNAVADALGGVVMLIAMVVLTRTTMAFASEPDVERHRPHRLH